jgi:sulfur carrier protein
MVVFVNGEARELPVQTTVSELVDALGLAGRRLAIEINTEIVPRSAYASRRLDDGDRVEVVQAIGGGEYFRGGRL